MLLAAERGGPIIKAAASIALALIALVALAAKAQANELVFWENGADEPPTIGYANIDGSGGGLLNPVGVTLKEPEGMAFDSLTGRLYIASSGGGPAGKGEIAYVNVDGSGGGVLATPGAEVNDPFGVAIDPASRTIYWTNGEGGPEDKGSLAFARLDGSGGGPLNTAPVVVDDPYRLAIDPVSGRVFWGNEGSSPDDLAYANMNNTGGGGTLPLPVPKESIWGIAVDSAAGRVYWLNSDEGSEQLLIANVNGTPGGEVNLTGAVNEGGYGLAVDPGIGRIYWANYGRLASTPNAIGFVNLAGGGGAIVPATTPVNRAQDPVILKSPSGTAPPIATRSKTATSLLSCSPGEWAADLPGSFLYQAPRTLTYQWLRNGKAVATATASTFSAKSAGKYACAVTAANQAGTVAQTSLTINIKAAKLKLSTKKKAKADAGDLVKFKVKAVNQGDLTAKKAKLCVKLPRAAKDDLKAPKCKKLGQLKGRAKRSVTIKVKVKPGADLGTDKLTFKVKGAAGKAAKSKIIVK
jgi:hypothetical protein